MTEPTRPPREQCWRFWRHNPHTHREAGSLLYCPGLARGTNESATHTISRLFLDVLWLGTTPSTWLQFYSLQDRDRRESVNLEAGVWPEDTLGQIRIRRAGAQNFVRIPIEEWTPIPGLLRAQVICRPDWEVGDFVLRHPRGWNGNLSTVDPSPTIVKK